MLPIEYTAVIQDAHGKEAVIDLETPGWLVSQEVRDAVTFTLQPKADADLPVVSVHLPAFADGTPRRLIYFSRLYGQVKTNSTERISTEHEPLFRLYCIGWEATIGGRALKAVNWIYPGGSVVAADEPPYVNEMIEHHVAARDAAASE